MAVKAVVLDLDGTLLDKNGDPVLGVPKMIEELRQLGLRIAIASNQPGAARKVSHAGLDADVVLDRSMVGENKGSSKWVARAVQEFEIKENEIVWLGDSDNDMRSAVNSRVIYFNAKWSKPEYLYGIHLVKPGDLPRVLKEFFLTPVGWYWQLSETDRQGRQVTAKSMMDANGAGIDIFKNDLIKFLKDKEDPSVGPLKVREFIFLHLIGSVYQDDFYRHTDFWTVYPGSKGGRNDALGPFGLLAARLFKNRYLEDLLIRHIPSIDSGEARRKQIKVDFANQTDTMQVNERYRRRILGKRIVVVDDFTTEGYSSECARLLLLQAGAADVICINVGKYGSRYAVASVNTQYTWNPCNAISHPQRTFELLTRFGQTDRNALTVINQSYQRIRQTWRNTS